MKTIEQENLIRNKFEQLRPFLTEKQVRLYAAAEALSIGYGGISLVARSTHVSRRAITQGCKELQSSPRLEASSRIRRQGGGRKKLSDTDQYLKDSLEQLIAPKTRGDPESLLKWTSKSVRALAASLTEQGHAVSHQTVATLLTTMGYSLQANKKVLEGSTHPDRNAQFDYINKKATDYQTNEQPVISVDTKKKELIGDFKKNNGRERHPKNQPALVNVYDFPDKALGKASPYGVYDIASNSGWVVVGTDHDTAQFAVQSIRTWWHTMGKSRYPKAKQLLITADGGGSNGSRNRLWKHELQQLADELSLAISVCHFPPGTRKWNKIEHRLLSFISMNWRGKPLTSYEVVVNLIAATTTEKGLQVKCQLDKTLYPTGIKITDEQMNKLHLIKDTFHGDWNYTLLPRGKL